MKITHLNKTFETIHYDTTLTSEDIQYIRDNFYNIYSLEEANKQIYNIYYKNGKDDSAIYDYYFYELMCEAKLKGHKWTIKEFLESDDLIRYASAKVKSSIKIYPPQAGIIKNIRSVFRLSPSGTAAKLSNFPFGYCKDLLEHFYNQIARDNFDNKFIYTAQKNINYYDMSSGWGIRLLSAMSLNFNYYGTDPNTKLCQKLEELTKDFKKQTSYTGQVDIRNNGSENFIPEWTQKINLVFSSIPYFDLEQYSTEGEQSVINYPQYNDWLELYWRKTVKNVTEYLVDDGYFILNIKDIPDYNLINDTKNIAIEEGFLYIGEYKDNSRALHDEEAVMIFVKEDKIKRINIQ